jgi:glycosyltransferase involved in cell wall biosynthesis
LAPQPQRFRAARAGGLTSARMDDSSVARGRNILFLLSTLHIGGSERKTIRLANALVCSGHQVTVAYLNGPQTLLTEIDLAIEAVDLHRTGKFSFASLRRLRQTIVAKRIDTVVCVNLYPALYAGLLAKFSRSLAHVRFIASMNTTEFRTSEHERRMLLYRPLLRSMDLLIFGAEYQRDLWQRNYLGRRAPQTSVLYNGIDIAHFRREHVARWRVPHWPSSRVVVGAVSRLRPEKSHDHLLRAIAELHRRGLDVGAVIVGEGDQDAKLRELVATLKIEDRVHLVGAARDVRPYLAGFDIFVITSTAVETFSNAALEALAMQCPVVSSRIGGMPEMLAFGGGVTYETGNVAELTEALQGLVVSDQLRERLAQQARSAVIQRFSLEAMVESFRSLLSSAKEPARTTSR